MDLRLIADGRLKRIERPDQVDVVKRDRSLAPTLRNPEILIDAILAVAR